MAVKTLKAGRIESRKLHDRIEEHLTDLILDEGLRPGDRLPSERDLATMLGVGRGSVRQALVALELSGVVEIRSNAGAFVAHDGVSTAYGMPSAGDEVPPLDIIAARRAVEGETAALAAGHAPDAALAAVARTIEEFEAAERRYDLGHPADRGFHIAIAEASGNRALARLVVELWDMQRGRLYRRLEDHFSTAPMRDLAIQDHERIVAALLARDPVAARGAMHAHLDRIYLNLSTGALGGAAA